jgi:hypothetical protein
VVDFLQGHGCFIFATASKPTLHHIWSPVYWTPWVKEPEMNVKITSVSVEVKTARNTTFTSHFILHGVILNKHMDDLTFQFSEFLSVWISTVGGWEPRYRCRCSDWLRAWRLRVRSSNPGRVKNFHFSISSRPTLRSSQPHIQWVPGQLSLGVKRQGREADHWPPTSAEVKKTWIYTSIPPYAFMA